MDHDQQRSLFDPSKSVFSLLEGEGGRAVKKAQNLEAEDVSDLEFEEVDGILSPPRTETNQISTKDPAEEQSSSVNGREYHGNLENSQSSKQLVETSRKSSYSLGEHENQLERYPNYDDNSYSRSRLNARPNSRSRSRARSRSRDRTSRRQSSTGRRDYSRSQSRHARVNSSRDHQRGGGGWRASHRGRGGVFRHRSRSHHRNNARPDVPRIQYQQPDGEVNDNAEILIQFQHLNLSQEVLGYIQTLMSLASERSARGIQCRVILVNMLEFATNLCISTRQFVDSKVEEGTRELRSNNQKLEDEISGLKDTLKQRDLELITIKAELGIAQVERNHLKWELENEKRTSYHKLQETIKDQEKERSECLNQIKELESQMKEVATSSQEKINDYKTKYEVSLLDYRSVRTNLANCELRRDKLINDAEHQAAKCNDLMKQMAELKNQLAEKSSAEQKLLEEKSKIEQELQEQKKIYKDLMQDNVNLRVETMKQEPKRGEDD